MNNKLFFAGVVAVGSLVAGMAVSCKSNTTTADSEPVEYVEYAGEQFRNPSMENAVADTVLDLDGTDFASTRISRSAMVPGDSSCYVAIDVYASNDNINGALAKYIHDAIAGFDIDQDSVDRSIGIDSVYMVDVNGLTEIVDNAVNSFMEVVIPQAKSDNVPGISLSIDLRPVWANESYVTYSMAAQGYYGGAHGETDFYLLTFDLKTGSPMGFYNLVPTNRQEKVRKDLVAVISHSDDMNVDQYLAMVNDWVGNNSRDSWTVQTFPIYHVGLTEQGYVFCYPKYSIAPGREGCPVYVVPVKK